MTGNTSKALAQLDGYKRPLVGSLSSNLRASAWKESPN